MANLKSTIEGLASQFAQNVLSALRGASIDELASVTGGVLRGRVGRPPRGAAAGAAAPTGPARRRGKGGRLPRRSAGEIEQMVESIADLLAKKPDGLRAEQIRDALGVDAKELPRPLADGIKTGRLKKTGQKRATTYFLGGGAAGGAKRGRGRRK